MDRSLCGNPDDTGISATDPDSYNEIEWILENSLGGLILTGCVSHLKIILKIESHRILRTHFLRECVTTLFNRKDRGVYTKDAKNKYLPISSLRSLLTLCDLCVKPFSKVVIHP